MKDISLVAGDVFCVRSSAVLGKMIVAVEKAKAKDGQARYGHAGIITDSEGTTLEALSTIRGGSLDYYSGDEILIGRWVGMTPESFGKGLEAIKTDIQDDYPWWRLILHFIGFGKVKTGTPVCSELVCKFLIGAGCPDIGEWCGQNPDDCADFISKWDAFEVLFEGIWQKENA